MWSVTDFGVVICWMRDTRSWTGLLRLTQQGSSLTGRLWLETHAGIERDMKVGYLQYIPNMIIWKNYPIIIQECRFSVWKHDFSFSCLDLLSSCSHFLLLSFKICVWTQKSHACAQYDMQHECGGRNANRCPMVQNTIDSNMINHSTVITLLCC